MQISSLFDKGFEIKDEALTEESKDAIKKHNKTLNEIFMKNTIKIKVSNITYFPYMAKLSSVKN